MSDQTAQHRGAPSPSGEEPSLGELTTRMSEDLSQLFRDELRPAQATIAMPAKHPVRRRTW